MTIRDQVINVSNLIWTDEVKRAWINRSAFIVQDVRNPNAAGVIGKEQDSCFYIHCGSERVEYGLTDYPVYLAAITEDGRYRLVRLEKYIKERDGELVFDVLDLPDQINGLHFQKAENFCNTPWDRGFNRPRDHVAFHTKKDNSDLWTIAGWSTVTFLIGASSAGKSYFIEKNFRDCGYTVLDVLDYQERAWRELDWCVSSWTKAYQANEWLKEDIVELVRKGNDVVVEQTFLRALRRIDCIDAIHEISWHIPCDIYVIMPSEDRLRQNCVNRWGDKEGTPEWVFKRYKREMEEIFEFPNRAEGFSRIFVVSDDSITQREDEPNWTLPKKARAELREDAERFASEMQAVRHRQRPTHIQDRQERSAADAAENEQ